MRYWILFSLALSLSVFGCEEADDGGSGALGEGCTNSGDCASDLCVDTGAAGQVCSQLCDVADAASCPMDYTCTAAGAASVCVPAMSNMQTGGTEVPVGGTEVPVGGTEMSMAGTEMPMAGTDMVNPDTNDCGSIVQCVNSCMDQSCVQDCFNGGTAEGQSRFNDLLGCIQGSVMNGTCGEEDFQCQNQACSTELNACVGQQGPTMTGNLSCSELNTCFSMCGPNDQNCIQECFNNGTATAQSQYGAIVTCAQSSGCAEGDNQCVNSACANEIQTCLGSGGAPAVGSLSCGGVFLCASSCSETDAACQQGCLNAVSADQADELNAFLGCMEMNMCQDQACVETNCSAEQAACFPPGTQSCGEVLTCIGMCTDQACAGECQLQASEEGTTELQALSECLNTNMCMSPDCPQCSTEYNACND